MDWLALDRGTHAFRRFHRRNAAPQNLDKLRLDSFLLLCFFFFLFFRFLFVDPQSPPFGLSIQPCYCFAECQRFIFFIAHSLCHDRRPESQHGSAVDLDFLIRHFFYSSILPKTWILVAKKK